MAEHTPSTGTQLMSPRAERADDTLERTRWELAALTGRLRATEAERDRWQRRYEGMTHERDRERALARKVARSESYRLGRAVVSFVKNPVRASPRLLRGVLRRLRRGRPFAGRVVVERPGRDPGAARRDTRLPVHLYVAIGLDPAALRVFVRAVSQRALVGMDHTPVVLTDSPTFSLLRNVGVLLEYVPDRATWQRHRDDMTFDDLLAARLTRLLGDHPSARTIMVDHREPPDLAGLLALDPTT